MDVSEVLTWPGDFLHSGEPPWRLVTPWCHDAAADTALGPRPGEHGEVVIEKVKPAENGQRAKSEPDNNPNQGSAHETRSTNSRFSCAHISTARLGSFQKAVEVKQAVHRLRLPGAPLGYQPPGIFSGI